MCSLRKFIFDDNWKKLKKIKFPEKYFEINDKIKWLITYVVKNSNTKSFKEMGKPCVHFK